MPTVCFEVTAYSNAYEVFMSHSRKDTDMVDCILGLMCEKGGGYPQGKAEATESR